MQDNTIHILSTRPLNDSLVAEAKAEGVIIDQLSFIETEPIQTIEVQQEIEQALLLSATVVFTSMNAVEAVAAWQDGLQPEWSIYCMGNTTRQLVKEYFGEESIVGTASSAAELAELMIEEDQPEEVLFFCGDQRRDELPAILRNNNIDVNEIVVYQTIPVYHTIEKKYAGILFFSPSAVTSFFKKNKLTGQTILFAIGNTTATEIKKYSSNKIIISDEPGKENMVRQVMEFFS
ncbi:MAG TPA: uroporphyrinogen-III synthase [Chitinophagaceae bacterium]